MVRNVDLGPGCQLLLVEFLSAKSGVAGANGPTAQPAAADAFYGLDPREPFGYSVDAGANVAAPRGPLRRQQGAAFVHTYIQEYADGTTAGSPTTGPPPESGPDHHGLPAGPGPVDGSTGWAHTSTSRAAGSSSSRWTAWSARATLTGRGFLRAKIAPVTVAAGQTVAGSTNAGLGTASRCDRCRSMRSGRTSSASGRGTATTARESPATRRPSIPCPPTGRRCGHRRHRRPGPSRPRRGQVHAHAAGDGAAGDGRPEVAGPRARDDEAHVGRSRGARCGGMRLGPRRALRCQVERRRGPLGRVGARAGIVAGTKRVTLARSRGRRVARSPAAAIRRAPTSVAVSAGRMAVVASARARAEGRLSLAARAWLPGAGRCTGAGTASSGARCRLTGRGVTEGVVVSTSLGRAGGAVGRLRVLAGRVAVR